MYSRQHRKQQTALTITITTVVDNKHSKQERKRKETIIRIIRYGPSKLTTPKYEMFKMTIPQINMLLAHEKTPRINYL